MERLFFLVCVVELRSMTRNIPRCDPDSFSVSKGRKGGSRTQYGIGIPFAGLTFPHQCLFLTSWVDECWLSTSLFLSASIFDLKGWHYLETRVLILGVLVRRVGLAMR